MSIREKTERQLEEVYQRNLHCRGVFELEVIEKYEPKLFKAVNNIFGQSYEYTRAYRSFCEEMDKKYGSYSKYLSEKTTNLSNNLTR